ncbi:MAG: hydrogenase iron-sulfur subunit [Syntrophobacteraceae bacterium]|jgi:F420-non-reducing hydrogenase iron-sulfur subunit|nr:hydrogenase iron-sulfur subunit [Syntrophobacteraceae bacterium]
MAFEPKILAFACNWCAYAAADLAGIVRMSYPPGVRIIRVMCTGMVHPGLVQEAFQRGADGVMVLGCHPGECHYVDGNVKAEARLAVLNEMMDAMGIEEERFRLVWCSAAEADRFVAVVTDMTEALRALGPSPARPAGAGAF